MSENNKLKVGIAGYGIVGKRRRAFIDLNPHLKTIAVCDRNFKNSGVASDGLRYYSTAEELVSNEKLDILFVCLTNDVAAHTTKLGLKNNLHVFCEKPPGRNLTEVFSVAEIFKQHPHLKLKYGFNHRYHDSVKEALKVVREKTMGEVINARAVYGKSRMINFSSDWRTKRDIAGGGILLDQGIHMVDLLRLFVGDFDNIYSFVSNGFWKHDVEDNAYALMKTKNNVVAMLHSSATQWRHRFSLELSLTKGGIILAGILSGSKSYGSETLTFVYPNENDNGDPREIRTRYNVDNSWKEEIDEFANCILQDSTVKEGSIYEAIKTLHLVYRIYCSDSEWKREFNLNCKLPESSPILEHPELKPLNL